MFACQVIDDGICFRPRITKEMRQKTRKGGDNPGLVYHQLSRIIRSFSLPVIV